jgi:hypothetical protein
MDNPADTLDQTDEDILTPTVSDEAIEAAGNGVGNLKFHQRKFFVGHQPTVR